MELRESSVLHLAHPWHGVEPTIDQDRHLVFVESTPFDLMKYELDMELGLMKVDQPWETSSLPPSAYGFIPQTLCGPRVAQLSSRLKGDKAALDVFVLSERPIQHHAVLREVRVIGGIPFCDDGFVDDKLVAVLARDSLVGHAEEISDVPLLLIERITHFLTNASLTGSVEIGDAFGKTRARALLQAGLDDYSRKFR